MAADVRNTGKSDNCSRLTPSSPEVEFCSLPSPSHDSDDSLSFSNSTIPSYIIVQRQMRDVVLAQKAAVEHLVMHNIEVLNESRASFEMVMTSQDQKIKMLEKTITEDYVPREMYETLKMEVKEAYVPKEDLEAVRRNLEEEYDRHSQTRAKLQEVLDKLDVSLTQVTSLTKQLAEEKMAFDSACEILREEISEVHARNRNLESRLTEKSLLCEEQKCHIVQQQKELEALLQKQQNQMMKYKHMVMEADVERQQEVYLSQIFSGRDKKKI